MRLGPWVIMRMHPDEKTLRTVSQLTPALRELVARMARAEAKDAIQEIMEDQGLVYRTRALESVSLVDQARDTLVRSEWDDQEYAQTSERHRENARDIADAKNTIANVYQQLGGEPPESVQ